MASQITPNFDATALFTRIIFPTRHSLALDKFEASLVVVAGVGTTTSLEDALSPMPSSARKSSVGTARRGIQKAHIPYRGDNPEVGKKTGIAVQHVQRKSDGFEPFEEVMQQADGRTPPRPKGRKKKSVVYEEDDDEEDQYSDDDDEYGEMSMQLDSMLHFIVLLATKK